MKKNVTLKKAGFQRDNAIFLAIHTTMKDSLLIRHCPSRKAWFAPALHGDNSSKFSLPPSPSPQNYSYGVHCYNAITWVTYSSKTLVFVTSTAR